LKLRETKLKYER
jgi:hypothetical protein